MATSMVNVGVDFLQRGLDKFAIQLFVTTLIQVKIQL